MAMNSINNSSSGNNTIAETDDSFHLTGLTIVVVVVQVIVIVIALLGNILVCIIILVYERLRKTITNYFIFSLALSDIITASIAMPIDVELALKNHRWDHGDAMCNVFVTSYLVAAPLSILNLLAVSVDRYSAITDPLHYSTKLTRKLAIVIIVSLWTYAILFTVIAMAGWPLYPGSSVNNGMCIFNVQPEFSLVSSLVNFVIPTIIMCVLYFRIYKVAHAHARRITRQENFSTTVVEYNSTLGSCTTTSTERKSMSRNIKAAKTIALLVSAFLFCWMPFTLVSSGSILCGEACYNSISAPVFTVTLLIAYTNSALNPFLYAFHNKDFRESFRRLAKRKFHFV